MSRVREHRHHQIEALQQELRREERIRREDQAVRSRARAGGDDGPVGASRSRFRAAGVAAAAAVIAGMVVLLAARGTPASAIGLGLLTFGAVGLTLLVFYAIGRSEDEDRARAGRRRS